MTKQCVYADWLVTRVLHPVLMQSPEHLGVLIIRAWFQEDQLVARLTPSVDLDRPEPLPAAVSTAADLHAAIDAWLSNLRLEEP